MTDATGEVTQDARERVRAQIRRWSNELIDLTKRNTSLHYRPLKRGTLEIEGPSPGEVLEALLSTNPHGGRTLEFFRPLAVDPGMPGWTVQDCLAEAVEGQLVTERTTTKDLDATLRTLARQSEADLVDRGLHSLYVCFGMLEWRESEDADPSRSPLIFVPARLTRPGPGQPYQLRLGEDEAVLNSSLDVALGQWFDESLPVLDVDQLTTQHDLASYLRQVQTAVAGRGWTVHDTAVLKRATFHKEAMFRDLRDNLDAIANHDLVAAIADPTLDADELNVSADQAPHEDELDQVAPPEDGMLILDADASQRRAIQAARQGMSFVMDGPPGTGKSQTIANILSELMAAGRSVLFVSEKVAALDVVATRLREHGLNEFLFELHSHKASRKQVAAELGHALTHSPVAQRRLTPSTLAAARRTREHLTDYAEALNRRREPLGRSAHQVLGELAKLHETPLTPLPQQVGAQLSAEDVAELSAAFRRVARLWEPVVEGLQFPWRGLTTRNYSETLRTELERLLETHQGHLQRARELAEELAYRVRLPLPAGPGDAERIEHVLAQLKGARPTTLAAWWSHSHLTELRAQVDEAAQSHANRTRLSADLDARAGSGWEAAAPAGERDLDAAAGRLREAFPAAIVDEALLSDLRARKRWCSRAAEELPALATEAAYIANALGATTTDRGPQETLALTQLAERADALERPEAGWASRVAMHQVEHAIEALAPLVQDFDERHARLADTFTDDVYDLDLHSLMTRFEQVHIGWRKISGAYRADKRDVAAVTRTGKATLDVRERLPEAFELQQLRARLDEGERQHARTLGRYYAPRATDTGAAARALDTLRTAFEQLGADYDPERVSAQLAGEAPEDARLASRARVLNEQLTDLIEAGRPVMGEGVLRVGLRTLADSCEHGASALGELVRQVESVDGHQGDPSVLQARELLGVRRQVAEHDDVLAAAASVLAGDLGHLSAGVGTDWNAVLAGLDWVGELQTAFGGPLPPRSVERLHDAEPPDPADLAISLQGLRSTVEALSSYFEPERRSELIEELASGTFDDARDTVTDLRDRLDDVETWLRLQEVVAGLADRGWKEPLEACWAARTAPEVLPGTLEKALWAAWYQELAAEEPLLGEARADDQDAKVAEFRQLDREVLTDAAERVVEACVARRPQTNLGPAAIIQREAQKRRRHLPVKQLLELTADVTRDLKPVFMMSPLSVSQYLPSGSTFDVVVFDEASQITPADAINCIYRGRQLIVAGDEKQLPPTSFFQQGTGEEDLEDDQFEDFESILNPCKGSMGMESLPLRWHYRSRHENLITFSNYRFYEGDLVTFPSATTEAHDLGVELLLVDGVYRRGGPRDNPAEAAEVAERVLFHAERHPELTLGVVAFSQAQAETIENAVERARITRPELEEFFAPDRLDGFFVKNLESVQGDERDIMVFSIGYGPDENGALKMNFGPLNREGGWRRLNVAVTRARRRVEVVASLDAHRMDTRTTAARGVIELQRYLDYAARGPAALSLDLSQSSGDVESPLEESVVDCLVGWGYEVVPQLGAAGYRLDIAVRDPALPGRFLLGVECDGAAYHSSKVARDRDRLRQEVLEGLGWRMHRIWGPSWYRDRARQEKRLRAVLEAARAGGDGDAADSRRQPKERELEAVVLDAPVQWTKPYRVARVQGRSDRPPWDLTRRSELQGHVERVLRTEAPVHEELIARRIAHGLGFNTTKRLRAVVSEILSEAAREDKVVRLGPFVWQGTSVEIRVPDDVDDDTRRNVEHIPPEELQEAVYRLLLDARSADENDLLVRVARLFGFLRTGVHIRVALEQAIDSLVAADAVAVDEDGTMRPVAPGPTDR